MAPLRTKEEQRLVSVGGGTSTTSSSSSLVLLHATADHDALSAASTAVEQKDATTRITRDEPNITTQTLEFPYWELMVLQPGAFVVSDPFTVVSSSSSEGGESSYDFCIKLYPKGARAANNGKSPSGFGMSYRAQSLFPGASRSQDHQQRVGVYLQFLPRYRGQTVDASLALRLIGNQARGRPRFDVEWRAGMRFVASPDGKLAEGRANDFGAHLLQTRLLPEFLGINDNDSRDEDDDSTMLRLQVQVQLHKQQQKESIRLVSATEDDSTDVDEKPGNLFFFLGNLGGIFPLKDIRSSDDNQQSSTTPQEHNTELARAGRVVVPVLRKLSQRPQMFAQGAYPGVEYRILRIVDPETGHDLFYSQPGADYELRPIYPLVPQLERAWPVTVNERDIPKLYTAGMYNAVSALGSLLVAFAGLATAFIISSQVSLFYIPSRSMDPTLQVGDILLVEKVTPRFFRNYQPGDVVLFSPPTPLRDIVARSSGGRGLTSRDLFVKRVAASQPGDEIVVDRSTGRVTINGERPPQRRDLCDAEPLGLIRKYLSNDPVTLPPGTLEVLGDCSSVSIDSRVWGPLPVENVVGRPVVRLWPLSKFGMVPSLPTTTLTTDWTSDS